MSENKRIAIVEDEGLVAEDLKQTLKALGYEVAGIFSKGEEFLESVGTKNPNLVLMDIMLKGAFDGIETAQKLKDLRDIPVIYLTAYVDDDTLSRAKMTEPYGYIVKPFDERVLKSTIETAFYKYLIENKLRESEAKLFTTLKSIGDGIITTDTRGVVNFVNPSAERILGWTLAEVVGRHISEVFVIFNEETVERVVDPVSMVLEKEVAIELPSHIVLLTKDGKFVPIVDSAAPIRDEKGKFYGIVLVFQEISERRESEKKIEESERKYRTLFEKANDAVFLMEGDVFKECNRKTLEIFRCDYGDIINHTPFDFSPEYQPDGRPSVEKGEEYIHKALNGEPQIFEWVHKRKDGELFDAEVSLSRVDIQEKGYILALVRDISERNRYLRKLEESERKFRTLAEKALVGIYILQDGKFVYINPKLAEITGSSREELIGRGYLDFIHPDFREEVKKNIERRLRGETDAINYELKALMKDGKVLDIEVYGAKIEFGGKPAVMGTLIDRTKEKRIEEELVKYKIELERKYSFLEIIHRVSDIANRSKTVKEMVRKVLEVLSEFLGYARASIYYYNKEDDILELLGSRGYSADFDRVTKRMPIDGSLNGYAIRKKDIIVCNDLINDERVLKEVKPVFEVEGLRSAVIVPLISDGEAWGSIALVFDHLLKLGDFEFDVLRSVSDTISVGMKKIWQMEELRREIRKRKRVEEKKQKYYERLKILRQIDVKILSSRSIERVIDYILKSVRERLNVEGAAVVRIEGELEKVRIVRMLASSELLFSEDMEFYLSKGAKHFIEKLYELKMYVVPDVENEKEIKEHKGFFEKRGVKAFVIFPLIFRGKMIGIFGLGGKSVAHLRREDFAFCRELSGLITLAFANFEFLKEGGKG